MAEEVSSGDILNAVSDSIMSGPGDDAWDNIRDQILSAQKTIILSIDTYVSVKVDVAKSSILSEISKLRADLVTPVAVIKSGVTVLLEDMITVLGYIRGQVGSWASGISQIISSIANGVGNIIGTTITSIGNSVAKIIPAIASGVSTVITTLGKVISTTFSSIVSTITTAFSSVMSTISMFFSSIMSTVTTTMSALAKEVRTSVDWMARFITKDLPGYIAEGAKTIISTIMAFTTWVPQLLSSMFGWAEEEVPGSSPRGEGIFESIFKWIVNAFKTVMQWFATFVLRPIVSALVVILSAIADIFRPVTQVMLEGVLTFLTNIGPISPGAAVGTASGLTNIGLVIVGMLGAMTVAGHLIHPFQTIGLNEVSAMIWDMSNFRVVIGAFMGVVAALAIRVPLTYYLNQALRPQLPSLRDGMEMYSQEAIDDGKFGQLLAYHGLADEWHEKYKDIAWRGVSIYQLRLLAGSGFFDSAIFERELKSGGYRPDMKKLLLQCWQSTNLQDVRGMFGSYAMTRYKLGYSSQSEFRQELELLGYPNEQIPLYIAGGEIAYTIDFIDDLKAAYTTATLKGQLSLGELREALVGLGIRSDRVAAHVLKVRAQLKPKEKLTLVPPVTPVYETEAGKVQVDTIRRKRRQRVSTKDEEIASLLELGMDISLATATADNDDYRLQKEREEE